MTTEKDAGRQGRHDEANQTFLFVEKAERHRLSAFTR
jgi:hypothetical protein